MSPSPSALAGAHVLVAGLGDIGAEVARRLAAEGARVTGVRRGADAPAGVRLLRADLAAAPPRDLPAAVDYLLVCLAPDAGDDDAYRRAFVDATGNLLGALAGRRIRRAVLVSSSAVYGQSDGEWVDEASPAAASGFRARRLLEGEAALRASVPATTTVRFAGIYGPGRLALVRRVLEGRGAPARPVRYTNRIHRDDAISTLIHLLALDAVGEPPAPLYIGADDAPAPRDEVLGWLAARLGVVLECEVDDARAGSKRLSNARLKGAGVRLAYPDYRAGYGALLDAMEASGELDALRRSSRGA